MPSQYNHDDALDLFMLMLIFSSSLHSSTLTQQQDPNASRSLLPSKHLPSNMPTTSGHMAVGVASPFPSTPSAFPTTDADLPALYASLRNSSTSIIVGLQEALTENGINPQTCRRRVKCCGGQVPLLSSLVSSPSLPLPMPTLPERVLQQGLPSRR